MRVCMRERERDRQTDRGVGEKGGGGGGNLSRIQRFLCIACIPIRSDKHPQGKKARHNIL